MMAMIRFIVCSLFFITILGCSSRNRDDIGESFTRNMSSMRNFEELKENDSLKFNKSIQDSIPEESFEKRAESDTVRVKEAILDTVSMENSEGLRKNVNSDYSSKNVINNSESDVSNRNPWKSRFFILLILVMFYLIYELLQMKKKKLIKQEKTQRIPRKNDFLIDKVSQLQMGEEKLKKKISILEQENEKLQESIHLLQNPPEVDEYDQEQSLAEEESISNPIELSVTNVIPNQNFGSSVLYAGKPTQNGEFLNIHTSINETESVFKLTVKNEIQAEFEVIIPSKIMEKYITNAPSDFLYRVCNHVNSNRDFTKEIITLKKGIAELVDEKWIVKEENKALIKFQ